MRRSAIVKASVAISWTLSALATPLTTPAVTVDGAAGTGADVPPVGRSLFDELTGDAGGFSIPYPFEKLVAQLRTRGGCAAYSCTRQVVIPLGRSLQRPAAVREYFRYPRIVVAFDREPEESRGGLAVPLLRDRLFLGYQEKTNVIEIISYNSAAGRFEFQLVKNYRVTGKPQVVYARRAMCASCHQGLAPIFSRPLWQETNANPMIAERLSANPGGLHGVPASVSVDEPNAIDAATERANRLATAQTLWTIGCEDDAVAAGRACRAALLKAALQYRLSGGHGYAPGDFAAARERIASRWLRAWPGGLRIPDSNIPNRIPDLTHTDDAQARRAIYVPALLEPLAARAPRELWREFAVEQQTRLVTDLGSFFSRGDIQQMDRALRRRASQAPRRRIVMGCPQFELPRGVQQRIVFDCANETRDAHVAGRVYLNAGIAGAIDSIAADGNKFNGTATLSVVARPRTDTVLLHAKRGGLSVRGSDGTSIDGIEIDWSQAQAAQLTLTLADDAEPLRTAIDALLADTRDDALSALPFRRANLLRGLGRAAGTTPDFKWSAWCCKSPDTLPPALADASAPSSPTTPFHAWCASCHAGSEQFPPSFLSGTAHEVAAKLKQCAPRIFQRLSMWQLPEGERNKTPMPPASALPADSNGGRQAAYVREMSSLAALAARLIGDGGVSPIMLNARDADAYEMLPPCVFDGSHMAAEVASR